MVRSPISISSGASSAAVVWAIATAGEPITSKDIAEILDTETDRVTDKLVRMYRDGLLVRRECQNIGFSDCTYEYALAARPSEGGGDDDA